MRFVHYPDARELDEAPGYEELSSVWPEFLRHDAVSNRYWNRLYTDFAEQQFLALDGERVVGEGNCVPVRGMPMHWRDAFPNAWEGEGEPDRVCALAIVVAPSARGAGRSSAMLEHMRELARPFGRLVAPVRPTLKHRHPHVPVEEYATWRREDGSHFDPWIRTHERLGGTIVGCAEGAMVIDGSTAEWESWTGLELPQDGDVAVPGALALVRFERGRGVYREPCVWLEHAV